MREPVGDHESERMLGARPDGRPVSARTVVLMPLKVDGKMSFFRGREVFGGAMVVGCCWYLFVVWVCWCRLERIAREGCGIEALGSLKLASRSAFANGQGTEA